MRMSERKKVDIWQILVGLNDGKTGLQSFETEKYVSIVDYICRNNGIAYTLGRMRGGYRMQNGAYINENSLQITLVDATEAVVDELADELCALFGQECVLVLRQEAECYYLSKSLM